MGQATTTGKRPAADRGKCLHHESKKFDANNKIKVNDSRGKSKKRFVIGRGLFRRRAKVLIFRQETIGDALAPEDQFELEIPAKKPIQGGILRRKNNNKNLPIGDAKLERTSSSFSSLSSGSVTRRMQGTPSLLSEERRRRYDPNEGRAYGGCCGPSAPPSNNVSSSIRNNTNTDSATGNRRLQRTPAKYPSFFQWLFSCGGGQTEADTQRSLNTTSTHPAYHRRPDNALADNLEDDDVASFVEEDPSDGVLRDNTTGNKKSLWKRIRSVKGRSISRLRRSISKRGARTTSTRILEIDEDHCRESPPLQELA
jgi:hypothetical protein